ncbi:catalase [Pedobacter sp. NJ-S-72]
MIKPVDMDKVDFNPLDPTKIWPENEVKMVLVGKMTLNKWPDNFFEQVEEAAFSPADLIPGIEPSEDKLLQGRLFSYFDTQRYRIGPTSILYLSMLQRSLLIRITRMVS